jgi:MFS family permease
VLIVAVHNSVERRELGIATAVTGFFRALGGAVGAAVLGAVFAARADGGVVDGVRAVFLVAAPLAVLGLLAVALVPEKPLEPRR